MNVCTIINNVFDLFKDLNLQNLCMRALVTKRIWIWHDSDPTGSPVRIHNTAKIAWLLFRIQIRLDKRKFSPLYPVSYVMRFHKR